MNVQLTEEQRQNMVAMFNLDGVDFILFLFCDLFADDGADESRSFASDSLATLTVGALFVSHNSCVVYCFTHLNFDAFDTSFKQHLSVYYQNEYQMHPENN